MSAPQRPTLDEVTTPPTIKGDHGRAWLADMARILKEQQVNPAEDATVCSWLVEAPDAHPFWHSYWVFCIHLRPLIIPRPVTFYLLGATHELGVWALDPKFSRQQFLQDGVPHMLTPGNFAGQFMEPNDAEAFKRVEKSVHEICAGELSPDTDFLRQWVKRYGAHMVKGATT